MQDFVAEHGHARISQDYVDKDEFKLGVWVGTQLQHKRQGKLSPRRTAAIEAVSGWTWDPPADRWEEGFSYLGRYVEREGDSRVVITHVEDAFRLGSWVRNQRVRHTRGSLDSDQVARLEALPDWTWDPLADRWDEGFTYLCRYVELKGDCRVPQSYVEDGYRLGWWVTAQRTSYRQGKLDRDRVLRLEAIPGWTWDARTAS
jgi:hypothetical protein